VAQYEPAVHEEQAVEPVDDWKVPARQLEQKLDEATEYFPAAQAPVTEVRPVEAQYDPPVHAVHEVDPVEA